MPRVITLLLVGVSSVVDAVSLVERLASAYGIAVSGTMVDHRDDGLHRHMAKYGAGRRRPPPR